MTGPPKVPPKSLRRFRGVTFPVPSVLDGERIAGVQEFVDEVVEARAVILIGAGFHGHVDDRGARLSHLGGVVAGLEGDFLNRIRVRLGHLRVNVVPEDLGGGVLAFDAHRLGERNSEAVAAARRQDR